MREDYRCDYFIGLEDNFPEEAVQEYTNRMLSLDEMRELYRKKWEGTKTPHNIGLKKDKTTGLYYTKYDFTVSYHDLLTNHILAELLFANRDQVDWVIVTNGYDHRIIKKIDQILSTPLVWIPVSDIEMEYVVAGVDNVAAEIYPPERFNFQDRRYWFLGEMREQGLLWFADNLPTKNDLYDTNGYDRYPETLVLWDRLLCAGYYDLFTPMETIVEKLGCAKVVRLIDRLRDEWDSLVALDFFRDYKIKDYEQDRLYRELTKGIEPHVQSWRKKAAEEAPNTVEQKSEATKQPTHTELHVHINGNVGQVIGKVEKMIQTKDKPENGN